MKEKIKILLIEDEEKDIETISDYIKNMDDIELIGITDDSNKAIELTKKFNPDVVILDIELSYGSGSGLNYLKIFNELELKIKPKIIVTTKISNEYTLEVARNLGANFILYKRQKGYNPKYIIETARLLFNHSKAVKYTPIYGVSTPEEDEKERLIRKIEEEFLHIGLSSHLKGTSFLADAIYIVATKEDDNQKSFRQLVYPILGKKYKQNVDTMHRNMINAIERTWRITDKDTLKKHYTQVINKNSGIPTVSEFIYYYAKKIKD